LIVFDPGPASLYAGVVVTTGETFGVYGPWDRERGMPTSGGDRIEGGFDGLTAYARIPRGALGDERALSEPGIRVVSYATTQIDEALGFLVLDAADGGRAFPLGSAGAASPETETRGAAAPPATAVPGVGFASFLAVAGAAALGCRARR
jgi:hypothetical protein